MPEWAIFVWNTFAGFVIFGFAYYLGLRDSRRERGLLRERERQFHENMRQVREDWERANAHAAKVQGQIVQSFDNLTYGAALMMKNAQSTPRPVAPEPQGMDDEEAARLAAAGKARVASAFGLNLDKDGNISGFSDLAGPGGSE